ncbi:MAG: DUF4336 domain-containing protein [Pseudomonadota bacterium]
MYRELGPRIWCVEGPEVLSFGFRYPTRMVLVRLTGGGLFVWSPVALYPALKAATDALGRVEHIVAPNSLHHLFVAEWAEAYPEAAIHAAPGLPRRRPDLRFHHVLDGRPAPGWSDCIDQVVVRGNLITTEVVFFHRPSGTVIFTDLIQNFPASYQGGWKNLIARLDLMVAPEPTVPRKFRVAFTNRTAARAAVQQILAWPAEQVVMAHGPIIRDEARACLARAFRWLRPQQS